MRFEIMKTDRMFHACNAGVHERIRRDLVVAFGNRMSCSHAFNDNIITLSPPTKSFPTKSP